MDCQTNQELVLGGVLQTYHIVGKDFNLTIGSIATLKSVTIFIREYIHTSETRAKCASNIIARKLDRTEQSSAINM